jgi:hypothetical protein
MLAFISKIINRPRQHESACSDWYLPILNLTDFESKIDELDNTKLNLLLSSVITTNRLDIMTYIHEHKKIPFTSNQVNIVFKCELPLEMKRYIIIYMFTSGNTQVNLYDHFIYFALLSENEMNMLINWNVFKDTDGQFSLYLCEYKSPLVKITWKSIDIKYQRTLKTIRDKIATYDPQTVTSINEVLMANNSLEDKYPSLKDLLGFLESKGMTNEHDDILDWVHMYLENKSIK